MKPPRVKALIRRLWKIAAPVTSEPGFWFSSEHDDPGLDWCRSCAEKRASEKGIDPGEIDGGWTTEHDSPPYCEGCGARLDYSPTNYCTEQELDHFRHLRLRKLTHGDAYDLIRIFEVAQYVKDQAALAVVVERTKRALRRAAACGSKE